MSDDLDEKLDEAFGFDPPAPAPEASAKTPEDGRSSKPATGRLINDLAPVETPENGRLFDAQPAWREHWDGMPEFVVDENAKADSSINCYFASPEDRGDFLELIGYPRTQRRGVWYPARRKKVFKGRKVPDGGLPDGRYPIYVISKGRADSRLTVKQLERLGLSFKVVVEPPEYDEYAAVIDPAKILTLPFHDLGEGSIPARNWVWEHSQEIGATRHWIVDDNIKGFHRLNENQRKLCLDLNMFAHMEEFVDRHDNVALAGPQYAFFANHLDTREPFKLNTRIYSCILIDNTLPFRWRGRYNEDTDLSLRCLKAGYCTVLFYAFLIDKMASMWMKGGNTDELYSVDDGRLKMAESLRDQHPDCVTVIRKWDRWQHHVDYRPFRFNELIAKDGPAVPSGHMEIDEELAAARRLEREREVERRRAEETETVELGQKALF